MSTILSLNIRKGNIKVASVIKNTVTKADWNKKYTLLYIFL